MSRPIVTQLFAPYIRQHWASLEGEIAKWLAPFNKTMEDVDEWELCASPFGIGRYRMRITISFRGSKEKQEDTFIYYIGGGATRE